MTNEQMNQIAQYAVRGMNSAERKVFMDLVEDGDVGYAKLLVEIGALRIIKSQPRHGQHGCWRPEHHARSGPRSSRSIMTPDDYRAALKRLGLTQVAAGRLFGVDGRTSQKWANGERGIPPPLARLLAYIERYGVGLAREFVEKDDGN